MPVEGVVKASDLPVEQWQQRSLDPASDGQIRRSTSRGQGVHGWSYCQVCCAQKRNLRSPAGLQRWRQIAASVTCELLIHWNAYVVVHDCSLVQLAYISGASGIFQRTPMPLHRLLPITPRWLERSKPRTPLRAPYRSTCPGSTFNSPSDRRRSFDPTDAYEPDASSSSITQQSGRVQTSQRRHIGSPSDCALRSSVSSNIIAQNTPSS